ncbi:hypothetical protein [Teredinibacter waterburyi]|jgi:hypothetical protein|uniref:hypothetical protein n=1 Tax=Teredinibacter waterburyi TaxID=1500538 RepID=UPI00165FAD5E|nr:hypothetical protein [Teredinibacter waterburyi]
MFIFTGFGVFSPILGFCALFALGIISTNNVGTSFLAVDQVGALIFVAASGINYLFGDYVNSRPGRVLIDPKTREVVELKDSHTFFWIPMQYWSFAFLLVSGSLALRGISEWLATIPT